MWDEKNKEKKILLKIGPLVHCALCNIDEIRLKIKSKIKSKFNKKS